MANGTFLGFFFEIERNGKVAEMMLHTAFAECKLCYLFYTVGMFDLTVQPCAPGCVSMRCVLAYECVPLAAARLEKVF